MVYTTVREPPEHIQSLVINASSDESLFHVAKPDFYRTAILLIFLGDTALEPKALFMVTIVEDHARCQTGSDRSWP